MAFCHWVWCLDPCKHCGSRNVELMYLGSKNRLDGGHDTTPITKCRDCGKWSDMPIERNFEMPKDKMSEFMEAVINISKSLNKKKSNNKPNDCPHCHAPRNSRDGVEIQLYDRRELGEILYWIKCHRCNLRGPDCDTLEEAIRLWNSIEIEPFND